MDNNKQLVNKEEKKPSEAAELTHDRPVYIPATDIYEKDDKIYVVCDLPGVQENNVNLSVENDVLSITAHQDYENLDKYELLHRGYHNGIYQRSFNVSDGIDRESIIAKMKNGVLTITLSKAEALKPRKIEVKIEK